MPSSRTCDNCLHAELSGNKPPCNICVGLDRWGPVLQPALQEVFAEMRRARELHGLSYMGNLKLDWNHTSAGILAGQTGKVAKQAPEEGYLSRLDVLLEEVGELADDVLGNRDHRKELVQVAAMALAWLGVDPGDAS